MEQQFNYFQQQARGPMSASAIAAEQLSFMNKVYMWMAAALTLTGLTAMYVSSSVPLLKLILLNKPIFYGLLFGELALVWYLSAAVDKMTAAGATSMFFLYAFVNGLTLSVIFLVYTASSIASTFFLTAATFAIMSAYGYFTKADLTSLGNLCFMLLIGLIIASIFNIFFASSAIYWVTTYLGIFVFVGLTAYDTQRIKEMNVIGNEGTEEDQKEAIMGALILYLDFINLFLYMLRLFGDRRNN